LGITGLLGTYLSGYELLTTSRIAAKDFDARMNTRSAREYTMFAPAPILRNWLEQRPSNMGDLGWSIRGEVMTVYCTGGGPIFYFIFVPWYVTVLGLRFEWYTLYYQFRIFYFKAL
jgi:hypothetical protein